MTRWAVLRGKKGYIFEGGHRVPFLLRWPGKVPAGTVRPSSPWAFTTSSPPRWIWPACRVPEDQCLDSVSLAPVLLGPRDDSQPVRTTCWWTPGRATTRSTMAIPPRARPAQAHQTVTTGSDYTPEELAMEQPRHGSRAFTKAAGSLSSTSPTSRPRFTIWSPIRGETESGRRCRVCRASRMTEAYRGLRASKRSTPVRCRRRRRPGGTRCSRCRSTAMGTSSRRILTRCTPPRPASARWVFTAYGRRT